MAYLVSDYAFFDKQLAYRIEIILKNKKFDRFNLTKYAKKC